MRELGIYGFKMYFNKPFIKTTLASALSISFAINAPSSSAFSCNWKTLEEQIEHFNNIFVAQVETVDVIKKQFIKHGSISVVDNGLRNAYFSVVESLKGSPSGVPYLISDDGNYASHNAVIAEKGEHYLIFANDKKAVELSTCADSTHIDKSDDYKPMAIRALLNKNSKVEIFQGYYLVKQHRLFDTSGYQQQVHSHYAEHDEEPVVEISFKGIRLEDGSIYGIETINERKLSTETIEQLKTIVGNEVILERKQSDKSKSAAQKNQQRVTTKDGNSFVVIPTDTDQIPVLEIDAESLQLIEID